ncbi:site-specific integrase [Defluviimonas sp. WL0002]|uniref:Site-specific integrase n=1 Tax=Albidovulum marisflavi TaxID=2984159 RepID=A0ABT2ZHQ2_9RHOB|nr:site-specific integrase [Defluviimonas sp. WL0002]MCV2870668.1 site-specific integrase [Defluviimonas sp. WL0002]
MPFRTKTSRFWQYDFQIKGRRFFGSCGTEDFEEAKAVEAAERVKARTDPGARGIFTLSEALGTYLRDVSSHQSSYATTKAQGKMILSVMDPKRRLSDLTNADLMLFVTRRRAEVSNATVNRQIDLIGRACRHMARIYDAKLAPGLDFNALRLKEPKELPRELSWDEQDRLFAHLRADLHPMVKFALMTGARAETICALRWDAVDFRHARIRFDLKGDQVMMFPMNGELRALLSSLPRAAGADAPFVFTYLNHRKKQPVRQRIVAGGGGLFADFRKACATAEIPGFRFHDLRHTFGTRMLRKSRNLKLVSKLMGHSSIETTLRYAHVLDDDLRAGVEDFSALHAPESRRKSRTSGK